jgi:hypothetical protein
MHNKHPYCAIPRLRVFFTLKTTKPVYLQQKKQLLLSISLILLPESYAMHQGEISQTNPVELLLHLVRLATTLQFVNRSFVYKIDAIKKISIKVP